MARYRDLMSPTNLRQRDVRDFELRCQLRHWLRPDHLEKAFTADFALRCHHTPVARSPAAMARDTDASRHHPRRLSKPPGSDLSKAAPTTKIVWDQRSKRPQLPLSILAKKIMWSVTARTKDDILRPIWPHNWRFGTASICI